MNENIENESVIDLVNQVELLFSDNIDGRKKKEKEEWKLKVNTLIDRVNKIQNFKVYKNVK